MTSEVTLLICNPQLTYEVVDYMKELYIFAMTKYLGIRSSDSKEFIVIAEKVPSIFMYLSAGYTDERGEFTAYNSKIQFD